MGLYQRYSFDYYDESENQVEASKKAIIFENDEIVVNKASRTIVAPKNKKFDVMLNDYDVVRCNTSNIDDKKSKKKKSNNKKKKKCLKFKIKEKFINLKKSNKISYSFKEVIIILCIFTYFYYIFLYVLH